MAIPSRQIGWSTKSNLLWQISKQLETLTKVAGNVIVTPTPTNSCDTSNLNLEQLLTNMNSCYTQVTSLFPTITYFTDYSSGDGITSINDGCSDMYDGGNLFNTNLTQTYNQAKWDDVNFEQSIPYTHTQDTENQSCNYTNPPMDGQIVSGTGIFNTASTTCSKYFTNMYPGMFMLAATGMNVAQFGIYGNLGSDGQSVVYNNLSSTNYPDWKVYYKVNNDNNGTGDPNVTHIMLVYGDINNVAQVVDCAGSWDDDVLVGLSAVNTAVITIVFATAAGESTISDNDAVDIADKILDVYNGIDCTPGPTTTTTTTVAPTTTTTSTSTSTSTTTTTLPPVTYYYNVTGYSCGTPCNNIGALTASSIGIPLTIGLFYNNPENRGYSFEILEEISPVGGTYDLTAEPGYATCTDACVPPTTTTTTTAEPTTTTTTTVEPTTTTTTTTAVPIPFLMTVNTNITGPYEVVLPYDAGATYTGTIDWGDGTVTANSYATRSHSYVDNNVLQITIDGEIGYWNTGFVGSSLYPLTSIDQFGTQFNFGNDSGQYFTGLPNLTSIPSDIPLTGITNMYGMFTGCAVFNSDISAWDVSAVTNMAYMFTDAAAFDQDLSAWNTSLVTNMSHMFTNASLFGSYTLLGPISNWDVSSVTNMSSMFLGASSFDQDLYNWNVSNVSDFTSFLTGATTFSSSNLGQIYNGWSALPSLQTGVTFDAPNTCYLDDAYTISNRQLLIDTYGWTINDAGVCAAPTTTTTTTEAPTYTIGQAALGGVIAYINGGGTSGTSGLVATAADISSAEWGCRGTLITGADGTAIGTGAQNTLDIVAGCATPGIAAELCLDLTEGGYSDWYLPSKDELNALYTNRVAIGGFTTADYSSSSELDSSEAWAQSFADGTQFTIAKSYALAIRPVRSF